MQLCYCVVGLGETSWLKHQGNVLSAGVQGMRLWVTSSLLGLEEPLPCAWGGLCLYCVF